MRPTRTQPLLSAELLTITGAQRALQNATPQLEEAAQIGAYAGGPIGGSLSRAVPTPLDGARTFM